MDDIFISYSLPILIFENLIFPTLDPKSPFTKVAPIYLEEKYCKLQHDDLSQSNLILCLDLNFRPHLLHLRNLTFPCFNSLYPFHVVSFDEQLGHLYGLPAIRHHLSKMKDGCVYKSAGVTIEMPP